MSSEHNPSFATTVVRHIKDHDIDIDTLKRGAKQLVRYIATSHSEEASITEPIVYSDFLGHEGLTMVSYAMAGFLSNWTKHAIDIRLFMFPPSFRLNLDMAQESTDTEKYFVYNSQAVAAFHGPTFIGESGPSACVPNNGFMFEGVTYSPFMDTNPPGERRGAMIFHSNGSVELADDQKKWELLSDPSGVKAISGTSDYIRTNDSIVSLKQKDRPRHPTSFLLQEQNSNRFIYCPLYNPISRPTILRLFQTLKSDFGLGECMGVELEYNGATGYIKGNRDPSILYAHPGHVGYKRMDHYYFTK